MRGLQGSFTVNAGALGAAVKYVAQWVDPKPSVPIHAGMLIEVADGSALVSAFGDDVTARARVAVEGDAAGWVVVSGRLLSAVLGALPPKPVTVAQVDSRVTVNCARFAGTLPILPGRFPALPTFTGHVGCTSGPAFAEAVHRIAPAARQPGDKGGVESLLGLHISLPAGGPIELMATNRYRAGLEVVPWIPEGGGEDLTALVPASVLADAIPAYAEAERVSIGCADGTFGLASPDRQLIVRQLGDDYPAEALRTILHSPGRARVAVETSAVLAPLKRINLLRDQSNELVTLNLTENLVTLTGSSEFSEGTEEIDAEYEGPECPILLRAGALQTAIAAAPGAEIAMQFVPGTSKPIIITCPAEPTWRYLVTPLVQPK